MTQTTIPIEKKNPKKKEETVSFFRVFWNKIWNFSFFLAENMNPHMAQMAQMQAAQMQAAQQQAMMMHQVYHI
jgi:hypothetical protein